MLRISMTGKSFLDHAFSYHINPATGRLILIDGDGLQNERLMSSKLYRLSPATHRYMLLEDCRAYAVGIPKNTVKSKSIAHALQDAFGRFDPGLILPESNRQ